MKTDTRTKVLDTALKLFAEKGYLGVSVRDIMSTAGVNIASAHYHFGSKAALYDATFLRSYTLVDKGRRQQLTAAVAKGAKGKKGLEAILRALVLPHYSLLLDDVHAPFVGLANRFLSEPDDLIKEMVLKHIAETRRQFIEALTQLLPDISEDRLLRGFSFVVDYSLNAPYDVGYEVMSKRSALPADIHELTDMVVSFGAAGLLALQRASKP